MKGEHLACRTFRLLMGPGPGLSGLVIKGNNLSVGNLNEYL